MVLFTLTSNTLQLAIYKYLLDGVSMVGWLNGTAGRE